MTKALNAVLATRSWTIFVIALCAAITAIVFGRGLFTPLGIDSWGRAWGYYVNYFDFGFVHRGLVGTIIALFVDSPVERHLLLPHFILPIFLLAAIVAAIMLARHYKLAPSERGLFLAILLLSPAFVTHYAYSTGDFNVLLATCFIATIILRNRPMLVVALLAVAMLVHELFFIVFVPALCVILYLEHGNKLKPAILYGAAAAMMFVLIASFGTVDIGYEEYARILRTRIPDVGHTGYLEMSAGLEGNLAYTRPLYQSIDKVIRVTPMVVYWLIALALFFPWAQSRFVQFLFVAACSTPIVLLPLGTDWFRWFSLAAVVTIVLGGFMASTGARSYFTQRPGLAAALLLPWVLVGPFGSPCDPFIGCERPLPMFQFALERIF